MMFGHDRDDTREETQNNPAVAAAEPMDDGVLSAAAPDEGALGAPAVDDDLAASRTPAAPAQQAMAPGTGLPTPPALDSTAEDLIAIKQEALQQLKPLVDHLDQTPEEKFRTTMMMIQAADDQSLINEAYEAAKAITDEKVRAQALLDVVNEINYFTAQKG
jgi:hypothetical protein